MKVSFLEMGEALYPRPSFVDITNISNPQYVQWISVVYW
jgi:hypothetical protein